MDADDLCGVFRILLVPARLGIYQILLVVDGREFAGLFMKVVHKIAALRTLAGAMLVITCTH